MLTIQILVKNNEATIEKCLKSLIPLKAKVIVADVGSTDDTSYICRKYGIITQKFSINNNLSRIRNELLTQSKTDWQMYIEPYEFIATGHSEILQLLTDQKASYNFKIVQGTVISKDIRLWSKKLEFINPVFETIKDNAIDTNVLIYAQQSEIDAELKSKIIENWKLEQPLSPDPYYYQALIHLLKGQYRSFIELANHYLFKQSDGVSATMLRYYLSMAQCYHADDANNATKNILICISQNGLMAEFWCLLGDINYKIKEYQKAIEFYENAILLGSRRPSNDAWPLDVSKYQDHPKSMIESAKSILINTKTYNRLDT